MLQHRVIWRCRYRAVSTLVRQKRLIRSIRVGRAVACIKTAFDDVQGRCLAFLYVNDSRCGTRQVQQHVRGVRALFDAAQTKDIEASPRVFKRTRSVSSAHMQDIRCCVGRWTCFIAMWVPKTGRICPTSPHRARRPRYLCTYQLN